MFTLEKRTARCTHKKARRIFKIDGTQEKRHVALLFRNVVLLKLGYYRLNLVLHNIYVKLYLNLFLNII